MMFFFKPFEGTYPVEAEVLKDNISLAILQNVQYPSGMTAA
jgi:hypothetical protein